MTFGESVSTCLKKYFVFEGRASRSEYWWFQLIVSPSYFISTVFENNIAYIFLGITLFTLIPAISVGVRRLHDTNRSGFFLLISFIPFIGGLVLLFFLIPPVAYAESACKKYFGENNKAYKYIKNMDHVSL